MWEWGRRRSFWLLNGLLLLLYLWTLGEQTQISVQVSAGRCLAAVPERTLGIDCPQLTDGSRVGLYLEDPAVAPFSWVDEAPLHWLAPQPALTTITLFDENGQRLWQSSFSGAELAQWQTITGQNRVVWGELRAQTAVTSLQTYQPTPDSYILTATLRRATDRTGLLLLAPDGRSGLAFVVSGANRRGMWWHWQDGRLTDPILGIPFQKPLLPQFQATLRQILRGHQAALLLFAAVWLLHRLTNRLSSRFTRHASRLTSNALRLMTHTPRLLLLIVTFLTFAATLLAASRVLERIPHVQDSLTYLFQAQTLAAGQLWAEAPPLPDFFEQEFLLVRDGRWFGKYPPGFPLLLALGVRLGLPWLVNPLLATLTAPLLYALGQELFDKRTGLLAAGLALVSPFFLFLSASHMAHAAELFWITLFMLSLVRAVRGQEARRWATAAGLALGMAFLTRQITAVAVAIPIMTLTLLQSQLPRSELRRKGAVFLLAALPLVALLLVYQGLVTGDPWQDPRLLYWPFDRLGFGPDVGESSNLVRIEPIAQDPGYALFWQTDPEQPPRGHSPARGLHNIMRNWEELEKYLFGWLPLLTTAFLWLGFLLRRPTGADWALLAALGGLLLAGLFYWHSGITYGPRYLYGALPALLLLTARGIQATAVSLGGKAGRFIIAGLVALLILGYLTITLPQAWRDYENYNFVTGEKVALVETAVPQNQQALVFVSSPTGSWWEYGELFMGNTPWLDGRILYARDLGAAQNEALASLYPNRTVYRFRNGQLEPGP